MLAEIKEAQRRSTKKSPKKNKSTDENETTGTAEKRYECGVGG